MPKFAVRGNANRGRGGNDAELISGSFGIHIGELFTALKSKRMIKYLIAIKVFDDVFKEFVNEVVEFRTQKARDRMVYICQFYKIPFKVSQK